MGQDVTHQSYYREIVPAAWEGELKEVQEDETRNNQKMKEQSELVLAMRQSGPPGWHWQAPANKSTESGAAARDS